MRREEAEGEEGEEPNYFNPAAKTRLKNRTSTYEKDCGTLKPFRTSVGSSSFASRTTRLSERVIAAPEPEKYSLKALLEIPARLFVCFHVSEGEPFLTLATSAIPTIFFTGEVE